MLPTYISKNKYKNAVDKLTLVDMRRRERVLRLVTDVFPKLSYRSSWE